MLQSTVPLGTGSTCLGRGREWCLRRTPRSSWLLQHRHAQRCVGGPVSASAGTSCRVQLWPAPKGNALSSPLVTALRTRVADSASRAGSAGAGPNQVVGCAAGARGEYTSRAFGARGAGSAVKSVWTTRLQRWQMVKWWLVASAAACHSCANCGQRRLFRPHHPCCKPAHPPAHPPACPPARPPARPPTHPPTHPPM